MIGQVEQSEKINELFGREKIAPKGAEILAFAILYERSIAPAVWIGPAQDPFAVEGESAEIRMARFLASKIIPGYQPKYIPKHLKVDRDTPVAIRQFRHKENLDPDYINRTLAVMLAKLLPEKDLNNCSALCLRGESTALGQTRFAIVVSEESETGVKLLREYKKQLMPGFEGTYMEYEATDLDQARKFLETLKDFPPLFYVEINTPEGGLGKDINGTYEFDI